MKKFNIIIVALALIIGLNSCIDDAPDTISTFTQERMGEYLQNRPEQFSEFTRLLDTTGIMGLVKAYGQYTLLVPNDSAMRKFYASMGRTSLAQFPLDTMKKIVYDHLIKGYEIETDKFNDGLLPYLTMSERYIESTSRNIGGNLYFFINQDSRVVEQNILVNNGIIHVIDHVIVPSVLNLVQAIGNDPKFSIFYDALIKTGMADSLTRILDESYHPEKWLYLDENYHQGSGSRDNIPESRKYGFTAFIESDSILKTVYNINTTDELRAYVEARVYHEDPADANVTNIKDRRNGFNKFVSYHLCNKKLPFIKIIDMYDTDNQIKTYNMFEYIEMMEPNTLMEVMKNRSNGGANQLNTMHETGEFISINNNYRDKDAVNGVYHELNKMLIYDVETATEMSTKRLRMDAAAFFPEFTNNNMRIYNRDQPLSWVYPPGYIKRLTFSEGTYFSYSNAYDGYQDYQSDEVYLKGLYDFEIETPCIPAGTYEVRFSYQPTGWRGAAQLYWDHKPCGIPLDLRIPANDPLVGYETPGTNADDPMGYENDKMMRNRGYMKGPCTYKDAINRWYGNKVARYSTASLRRILGTYTFKKSSTHIFTVKAVRQGQFMFDFLEFVPVEVIENEDIE